jgi:hypothetical protein
MGYFSRLWNVLKYHLSCEGLRKVEGFSYVDTVGASNELAAHMQRMMLYQELERRAGKK